VGASNKKFIVVRNGTIRGFETGVVLGDNTFTSVGYTVEDLTIEKSWFTGLHISGLAFVVQRNRILNTGGSTAAGPNREANAITIQSGAGSIKDNQILTVVSTGTSEAFGINGEQGGATIVEGNYIANIFSANSAGILMAWAMVLDNRIIGPARGIVYSGGGVPGIGKYRNNLTLNVTTPFIGGTDAGGNN
jgi:hypothetical protein